MKGGLFFSFEGDPRTPGGADVALVRREREDRDGDLLVRVLLAAQVRPLERARAEQLDAVGERHRAARRALAARVDDGLDGAVELGERHLERDLHGVQAELGRLPLLERLEH